MNRYLIAFAISIGLFISTPSLDSLTEEIECITITYNQGSKVISSDSNNKEANDILVNYNKTNNFIIFKLIFADVAESYNPLKGLKPKTNERMYFGIASK